MDKAVESRTIFDWRLCVLFGHGASTRYSFSCLLHLYLSLCVLFTKQAHVIVAFLVFVFVFVFEGVRVLWTRSKHTPLSLSGAPPPPTCLWWWPAVLKVLDVWEGDTSRIAYIIGDLFWDISQTKDTFSHFGFNKIGSETGCAVALFAIIWYTQSLDAPLLYLPAL